MRRTKEKIKLTPGHQMRTTLTYPESKCKQGKQDILWKPAYREDSYGPFTSPTSRCEALKLISNAVYLVPH